MSRIPILVFTIAIICFLLTSRSAECRTIAVVYDDSGSMYGQESSPYDLRFAYASYSLQTLRALLSKEDRLVVSFMNDSTFHSGNDPAKDIATLEARSYAKPNGSTPYETVDRAMSVLQAEQNDKERWLVIMTDGGFNRIPANLAAQIAEFQKNVPGVKVICFGIASGADNPVFKTWQDVAGATQFASSPSREIRGKLQQVAAMVTADTSGAGISPVVNGSELTFTSPFPLKRFIVLMQAERPEDLAGVLSAAAGTAPLQVSAPIYTRTPKVDPQFGTPSPLYGLVHHVQAAAKGGVVPETTEIKLKLAKALPANVSLTILPEVFVNLRVTLWDQTGAEIKSGPGKVYSVCKGRPVTVRASLDFGAAGKAAAKQAAGAKVEFFYDGQHPKLIWQPSGGFFSGEVVASEGTKPIRTVAEYKGFLNIQDTGQLQGLANCVPRSVSIGAGGVSPDGVWSADVRELDQKGLAPLELVLRVDGRPVGAEELKKWSCVAESSSGAVQVTPTLSTQGWTLLPMKRWCTSCLTPTGTFPVRIVYDGKEQGLPAVKSPVVTVRIIPPPQQSGSGDKVAFPAPLSFELRDPGLLKRCWKLIAGILVALAALIWIIGITVKNRFARGAMIAYERKGGFGRRSSQALSTSFLSRWIIPYAPETGAIEGMKFKAGRNRSHILLAKECLDDSVTKAEDPITNRTKDLRINMNETVEQRISHNVQSVYRYEI